MTDIQFKREWVCKFCGCEDIKFTKYVWNKGHDVIEARCCLCFSLQSHPLLFERKDTGPQVTSTDNLLSF